MFCRGNWFPACARKTIVHSFLEGHFPDPAIREPRGSQGPFSHPPAIANSARLMEDNPIALRLKELKTLEKVTEKIDKISVFGGLEGVLKDLVKIRP